MNVLRYLQVRVLQTHILRVILLILLFHFILDDAGGLAVLFFSLFAASFTWLISLYLLILLSFLHVPVIIR